MANKLQWEKLLSKERLKSINNANKIHDNDKQNMVLEMILKAIMVG
jgi:hypothetical protein